MLAKMLRHLQRQWMGAVALFLVLAGGTAYAANTVFSTDIVDGQVHSADIGNNQVYSVDVRNDTLPAGGLAAADLRPGSVAGSEIADNSISSSEVLANSLNGSDITEASIGPTDLTAGALGARAYGRVSSLSALSRSKNITSVTNPTDGLFCIKTTTLIDPSTAVLLVDSDWSGDATIEGANQFSVVEWASGAPGCPAGTLAVKSFIYHGDGTDNDGGGGDTAGDHMFAANEAFSFMIP
jgi:hypothetical protein